MRYDAALRMQQVTHAKGNIIHARTDYVFDQNGNRTKETINRNAAAQVTNYSYDKADRLTQTEVIDVNQTVTTAYTLDGVANRTKEIISTKPAGTASTGSASSPTSITKTYTYDGRNQLTAITDTAAGNTTLSYDNQGNLSQKTQGGDSTYYSYNARDNLISVRKNNTVLGNYSNNHLGLRVEKEAKDPLQPNAPPAIFRTLWNGRHAFQDSDTSGNTLSR
ncbi:RHS repeat protein, partial [Undibacterium sp. LX15W]|nr:RHS repeat protein [Undibacterium flavidum]